VKEEGNRKKRDSVERVKEKKKIRRKGGEFRRKEILPIICQFFVWHRGLAHSSSALLNA
jgi:hypothetical protein